jgi:hypothetical protein
MITETDEISAALDTAAGFWPHARGQRSELIRLLISKGIDAVQAETKQRQAEKHIAIEKLARDFAQVWSDDWQRIRDAEWPA